MAVEANDEKAPFDVAVFLARHWKVLIAAPVAIAGLAYLWAAQLPPVYSVTVSVPVEAGLPVDAPEVVQAVRASRAKGLTVSTAGEIAISASGPSKAETERRVVAEFGVISTALAEASAVHLARLEERRAILARGTITPDSTDPEVLLATINLLSTLQSFEDQVRQTESAIARLIETPTVAFSERRVIGPSLIALVFAIATFCVLCAFFGVKEMVTAASKDEHQRARIELVRSAFLGRKSR